MEYRLSHHAREEMQRRGIPETVVAELLSEPQQVVPGSEGRSVYQSQVEFADGSRYLVRAVVAESAVPPVVVTVYRTSRLAKYWRQP